MSIAANQNRRGDRFSLSLSAVVKAKESKDTFWKQNTDLISMSRSGAGFYLERKCEVGQLVSLMMPMPRHLRCYDAEKELYRVWGLVQHCSPVSGDGQTEYHVGVAFIGKNAPPSYNENPLQSYRIAGMNEDGTWRIVEAKKAFVVRRHHRYWAQIEVFLAAHDAEKNLITDETAKTENISLSGAAVISTLNVDVGDSVNFNSIPHNFSALAIVRNRQISENDPPRLHLEFINSDFPIEELMLPADKDVLDDDEITG
jgi:hypothetical protein